MTSKQSDGTIITPILWQDIHFGLYYRQALEHALKAWWPKLFGVHLLKIGTLSADFNTDDCIIAHQVSVGLEGKCLQVIADPYQLPFSNKSVDACLLAHTLFYTSDPLRLLREVNRVLIDDGWLIITTFNLISMLGLGKVFPMFFFRQPYRNRMYTQRRLLDWLRILNFEVLYRTHLQVLPWIHHVKTKFLYIHCPAIGCLSVIIARKRTVSLNFNLTLLKNILFTQELVTVN